MLKRLSEIEDKIDRHQTDANPSGTDSPSSIAESGATPLIDPGPSSLRQSYAKPPPPKTARDPATTASSNPTDAAKAKPEPVGKQPVTQNAAEIEQIWKRALGTWETGQKRLYGFLKDAALSTTERGGLKLTCPPLQISLLKQSKDEIAGTLKSLVGHPVDLDFVPGRSAPEANRTQSARADADQTPTPLALQREARQDPQLSPVLDLFDAKILKIELK